MEPRVKSFLQCATVAQLKEKLEEMGQQTSGNKAALILRVEESIKQLSPEQIDHFFPSISNFPVEIEQDLDPQNHSATNSGRSEDEELDSELEYLQEKLKKKQEILELKKKLMELNDMEETPNNAKTFFNFRDVEESLTTFSGDDNYSILKWIQHLEESAEVLGWNEKTCLVYARRLLTGTAKLFLRTSSFKSWLELKTALIKEFNQKISSSEVHNQLRNRKKKSDESYQQYVFSIQEIAMQADLTEADTVHYIINGINDTVVNKMILYGANNIDELKSALKKYEKIANQLKSSDQPKPKYHADNRNKPPLKLKCFNCNNFGHVGSKCTYPRKERGACYRCGKMGHKINECNVRPSVMSVSEPEQHQSQRGKCDKQVYLNNDFEFLIGYTFFGESPLVNFSCELQTLVDSGSPISFIQQQYVPACLISSIEQDKYRFCGINNSRLEIIGMTYVKVYFQNSVVKLKLFVVKNCSMTYPIVLGRDFIGESNLELRRKENLIRINKETNETNVDIKESIQEKKQGENSCIGAGSTGMLIDFDEEDFVKQILNIDLDFNNTEIDFKINKCLPFDVRSLVVNILKLACFPKNNCIPKIDFEMEIKLTNDKPFYSTPRRLPYMHKVELQKILDDLLQRNIIRESNSPYTSPIVLVTKKNKELRLCVDYRELNKVTIRDNYPLPLIEDHLDRLKDKKYFSVLDLKNGFHHVKVAEHSIKYTSFITPIGQFEYMRMPFGLKNAPAIFEKYMKKIFKPLIASGKILTFIDDVLIATETIEEHLVILKECIKIVVDNCLQLRFDKCSFLQSEITYLGYKINCNGIQPNNENLEAIRKFPIPTCTKGVQSFLGLCSYFRKFIKNFATLAKPLYDLLKKDKIFSFGEEELEAFEILKEKLLQSPVLAIFSPHSETELHCDASSLGYGSILMQKQEDGKFHPVAYFSKRISEAESKYHSFELETLSMIYALRRFRVYLIGLKFKIVTDCQSLAQTLSRKSINPRISRWALELQSYDFTVEHRNGNRMLHADALSRSVNILNVRDESFEYILAASQRQDPKISSIASELEKRESSTYEMIDGLIYRKVKNDIRFYVPQNMENKVIQTHHDALCHVGANKCYEHLTKMYWFPEMKQKIQKYIKGCLKCIYFSPLSGKVEGTLHSIPKGDLPFDTLHIDHYGPLTSRSKKRHVFLIVDGFSKFVKLYAVNSTNSKEAIKCLEMYFDYYSRPKRIVSDRGTCFTSQEFADFIAKYNIQHIKVATLSPQSNGQVERVNRMLTPMLAKECEADTTENWHKYLAKIEYAINNTVNRSTGFTPSMLLFGVNQKGQLHDKVAEYLLLQLENTPRNMNAQVDLIDRRKRAEQNILRNQEQNKIYYDKRHKEPHKYKKGEYVMLRNNVSLPCVNRKLFAKFRGPYEIAEVFDHDRYLVRDIDGMQLTRVPYRGVCSPANMRPFILDVEN